MKPLVSCPSYGGKFYTCAHTGGINWTQTVLKTENAIGRKKNGMGHVENVGRRGF